MQHMDYSASRLSGPLTSVLSAQVAMSLSDTFNQNSPG